MKRISCFIVCLLMQAMAFALYFPNVQYGATENIATGVKYYSATESSVPWRFFILEMDMTNPNVEIEPVIASRAATSTLAQSVGAVAAINAGFFNTSDGSNLSYFKKDGDLARTNPATWSTFGVTGNHNEKMVITQVNTSGTSVSSNSDWSDVIDAIGGGPNLVTNGAVNVTSEGFGWETSRHPRTFVGFNSNTKKLFFVVVDGRSTLSAGMTCTEEAKFLLDLGCDYGMNYDGGGSSALYANGSVKNVPSDGSQRSVPTIWAVQSANVVDDSDTECTRSGSWTSTGYSAYDGTGYYCDSPSTTNWMRWTPDLDDAGQYDVYVWYSSNQYRNSAVNYTVKTQSGTQTVTHDQTSDGNQWVKLGTYLFASGTGGYLQVNGGGSSGTYISADAVKFKYLGAPVTIVDDSNTSLTSSTGSWLTSSSGNEDSTHYAWTSSTASASFTWNYPVNEGGTYKVYALWQSGSNRESQTKYTVNTQSGNYALSMNQTANGSQWNLMGEYTLNAGETVSVVMTNQKTTGSVVFADAIKFEQTSQAAEPITQKWAIKANGGESWISSSDHLARGAALNPETGHTLVATGTGGNKIVMIDENGSYLGALTAPAGGYSVGTLGLCKVQCSETGRIIACNLDVTGTECRLYVWDSQEDQECDVIIPTTQPGNRYGDLLAVQETNSSIDVLVGMNYGLSADSDTRNFVKYTLNKETLAWSSTLQNFKMHHYEVDGTVYDAYKFSAMDLNEDGSFYGSGFNGGIFFHGSDGIFDGGTANLLGTNWSDYRITGPFIDNRVAMTTLRDSSTVKQIKLFDFSEGTHYTITPVEVANVDISSNLIASNPNATGEIDMRYMDGKLQIMALVTDNFVGQFELDYQPDVKPLCPVKPSISTQGNALKIDWTDQGEPDQAGFNIYRSTTRGKNYVQVNSSLITAQNYTDSDLPMNADCYYVVTTVDQSGRESIYSRVVSGRINLSAPVAAFTADPVSGVSPVTVDFTNQSTGDITSYAWDFDNNGVVDRVDANPRWMYIVPGYYSVTLTVSNAGGSDSITKQNLILVESQESTPVDQTQWKQYK